MAPLRWLRALYCVDANYQKLTGVQATERGCPATPAASAQFAAQNPGLFQASGVAVHPYSFTSLPPNVPIPNEPDYAELAVLPKLESTLDRLQRAYGSSRKFPIWSTEFGYITNPPNNEYTITPARAAYYLNWAEYIHDRDPRIRSYDQYLLVDPPAGSSFATGLASPTGVPKPTFYAYRMPLYMPNTAGSSGSALVVWGGARPSDIAARQTGQPQRVQLQFQTGARGPFKTIRTITLTDPYGYFEVTQSFSHSGILRSRWRYPSGEAVYSRNVAVTIH
jgi:hypothetical protein